MDIFGSKPIGRARFVNDLVFIIFIFFLYIKLRMLLYLLSPLGIILLPFALIWLFNSCNRRLKDLRKTSWMLVLLLVPIANVVLIAYLLTARGINGEGLSMSNRKIIFNVVAGLILIALVWIISHEVSNVNQQIELNTSQYRQ